MTLTFWGRAGCVQAGCFLVVRFAVDRCVPIGASLSAVLPARCGRHVRPGEGCLPAAPEQARAR